MLRLVLFVAPLATQTWLVSHESPVKVPEMMYCGFIVLQDSFHHCSLSVGLVVLLVLLNLCFFQCHRYIDLFSNHSLLLGFTS